VSGTSEYGEERVDRLPFNTPEKSTRYETARFAGAAGLNFYEVDPSLQALLRRRMTDDELAWAEPRLSRLGELCGGPVNTWAEETDRNPPRLERYDRWGHDVSRVVIPDSVKQARQALYDAGFERHDQLRQTQKDGLRTTHYVAASQYLLDQADIGMMCALGTGGDMVARLVADYAPTDIRDHVVGKLASGEWWGSTAQLLTERAGGSDLAQIETTATPIGDAWLLNGFKWFASNVDGQAWVVLAKPEGAPDGIRGVASFLVLQERRDGTRNGIRIRRLKDKLGTKTVASAEVELVDAEAFLLAPTGPPEGQGAAGEGTAPQATGHGGDGKGLSRMMELTNGARLGIAMMGLGCARRAFVEAATYASARPAFGAALSDHPLMRRKLVEMAADVHAVQALVFDAYSAADRSRRTAPRLRLGAPLAKLLAARLGVTAASDAIEVHGGNGYIESWPVARILRDAQVNTIWEGADNILCLDVRRAIEREEAHLPLLERMEQAASAGDGPTAHRVQGAVRRAGEAVVEWQKLDASDRRAAELRLFPLSQGLARTYAAAALWEQAAAEAGEGDDRRAVFADLWIQRRLGGEEPFGELDSEPVELTRFDDLMGATLICPR
jgi:acyl-CoA dehydrogenase